MPLDKKNPIGGPRPLPQIVSFPKPYDDARNKLVEIIKLKTGSEDWLSKYTASLPEDLRKDALDNLKKQVQQSKIDSYTHLIKRIKNLVYSIFLECDALTSEQSNAITKNIDDLISKCDPQQKKIFTGVASGLTALLYHKAIAILPDGAKEQKKELKSEKNLHGHASLELKGKLNKEPYLKIANKLLLLNQIHVGVFKTQEKKLRLYQVVFQNFIANTLQSKTKYDRFLKDINDGSSADLLELCIKNGSDVLNKMHRSCAVWDKKEKKALKTIQFFLEAIQNGLITPDFFALDVLMREFISSCDIGAGAEDILTDVKDQPLEEQLVANFLSSQISLSFFGMEDNLKKVFLRWFVKVFFRTEQSMVRRELFIQLESEVSLSLASILHFFRLTYNFPYVIKNDYGPSPAKNQSPLDKKNKKEIHEQYRICAAHYLNHKDLEPCVKELHNKALDKIISLRAIAKQMKKSGGGDETLFHLNVPTKRAPLTSDMFTAPSESEQHLKNELTTLNKVRSKFPSLKKAAIYGFFKNSSSSDIVFTDDDSTSLDDSLSLDDSENSSTDSLFEQMVKTASSFEKSTSKRDLLFPTKPLPKPPERSKDGDKKTGINLN